MFDKKGTITIDKKTVSEDELMEVALDAGADDVHDEESEWEVITEPSAFENVKKALLDKKWKYLDASVGMVPQNTIQLDEGKAEQMLRLMEKLEDNDDVQNVYANFDISDEIMDKLSQ
jgi:transcriptional/translational regulatory protein YebC/TACO1